MTIANRHAVTYPNTLNIRGLASSDRRFLSFVRIYIGMYNTTVTGVLNNEKQRSRGTNRTAHARSSIGASAPLMASTHSEGALVSQELCTAAQFRIIHISNSLPFIEY